MKVNIQQLRIDYLLAAGHPDPYRARAEMDATATDTLGVALAATLAPHRNALRGLWFIRQLHVTLEVNRASERAEIARSWADRIGRVVTRALEGGSDGCDILWFPDYAAFLARFLLDLVNGSAWHKWPYARFDGLRSLPLSAALRTAICDRPSAGRAALSRLGDDDCWQLLCNLTLHDARRAFDQLTQGEEGNASSSPAANIEMVWPLWERSRRESGDAAGEARYAVYLLGAADAPSGAGLRQATRALARLARLWLQWSPQKLHDFIAALYKGELASLYLLVGAGDAEILSPLWQCRPEMIEKIATTLVEQHTPVAPVFASDRVTPETRLTKFGQLFLLAPMLDEMLPASVTKHWPVCTDVSPAVLVRFLILAKCCGQVNAAAFFADSLARDLFGIPQHLPLEAIAGWQRQITRAQHQRFLAAWLAARREQGAVGDAAWVVARVAGRRGPLALLIDSRSGLWLDIWRLGSEKEPQVAHTLARHLARAATLTESQPVVHMAGFEPCGLDESTWAARLHSHGLEVGKPLSGSTAHSGIEEIVARLDKAHGDVEYLTLPHRWRLVPAMERLLSIAAQSVMRAFAWRLPGFAFTSLPYLDANFLRFPAQLEVQETQRVARLGRPPLHLLLQMSGMARTAYRLSWLDDRPFVLTDAE